MPGTYSKVKTVITGETITATDRNAEHDNHINNCDFSGLGDYSVNTTQMQSTADPYPGSAESLATTGAGELERLRYLIKQITGEAQWYIDPDSDIATIVGGTQTFAGAKTFSSAIAITATTNHIAMSTAAQVLTLKAASQASAPRVWTIPDISTDGTFASLNGTQTFSGSKTFSSQITVTATSLHFVLSTAAQNLTLQAASQAVSSRVWTIPDISTDGTFVSLNGTQTFSGSKTFSLAVAITATSNHLVLSTSSNTLTISAAAQATSARIWTVPDISGDATFAALSGTQTFSGTKTFTSSSGTGFGNASAPSASTLGGIDIWSGGLGVVIGADSAASTRTNTTSKFGRFAAAHYTNAEEPIGLVLYSSTSSSSAISIGGNSGTVNAATNIDFFTAADITTTSGTLRLTIDTNGNIVVGSAAIATNATNGFLYIPTCAGTPTGAPTAFTGRVAIVYDTSNNKFYVYNGAWKGGTAPGAWS